MAGSKSVYLEAALLDHVLGLTTYTPPAIVYVALSTDPFDPSLTGGTLVEVVGGSYARMAVTNDTTNWPDATSGAPAVKSNGTLITFPTATADWGTIDSVYLLDADPAGNVLYGADLLTPAVIDNGSTLSITVGSFVLLES